MLKYFIEGTDILISGFDINKKDPGYSVLLEYQTNDRASSHHIKIFFIKFIFITDGISTY
jgi:hypothetical protein